jgi:uncharacterized OB-fold protein
VTVGERIPVVEGLFFEDAAGARLLGSRCAACGTPYFPRSDRCRHPDCGETQIEDAVFGPFGTLWSYSVQNYPPPAPARYDEPYRPYALAVVDLADGLRVVGRLTDDTSSLRVGAPVELVLGPLCHEDDGGALITWMFRLR